MRIHHRSLMLLFPLLLAVDAGWARPTPQSSAITYQGRLTFNGQPATTTYDFECRLYDAEVGGNQVGPLLTPGSIEADDQGVFTMALDFGALAFDGSERWLQLGVRESGGGPTFTPLTPRQKIEAAPYAAFALRSGLSGSYAEAVTLSNPANAITGAFSGSGAGLSNLNAGALSGIINSANISGSYTNAVTLNNAANAFSGSGAGLTALNASNLSTGTVGIARLPSGGNWSLATNLTFDTDLFFINPTNNLVGIGTTSPGAPLDVQRTSSTNIINPLAIFRAAGTGTSSGSLRTQNSAGNHFNFGITAAGDYGLGYNANIGLAGDLLRITPTGSMGLGTPTPANRLDVEGGVAIGANYAGTNIAPANGLLVEGSVGIGTASPSEPLHIVDSLFSTVLLDRTSGSQVTLSAQGSAGQVGTANAFPFRLLSNNTVRLTVTPTGDVGVGTTGPLAKLHVNGDVRVDGNVSVASTNRYCSVSPYAFVGTGNVTTNKPGFGEANGAYVGTVLNSGEFSGTHLKEWMAPVNLPDGVVVNELLVRAYDLESDVGVDLTVSLRRSPITSGTTQVLASVATSGTTTPTPIALTDVTISNSTIDNSIYTYWVQIDWPGTGTVSSGAFGVYGIRLRYAVTSPLP